MSNDACCALLALVDAIENAGGVKETEKGYYVPVCDEDWVDLGDAYELACDCLKRKMKVVP